MTTMVEKVAHAIDNIMFVPGVNTFGSSKAAARAAIEAMRPTNGQILAAIDEWLSDAEGFSLRAERMPTEMEVAWLRHAALVGASVAFPVNEEEPAE